MPTRRMVAMSQRLSQPATKRPTTKIASAATARPVQSSSNCPSTCGSNHFVRLARNCSMRKLSRHARRPSKRRCSCGTRHGERVDAWGILMRMKRLLTSLVALLLAACATGSKTDGSNVQVEVDSHGLLGDIAFERQQLDTATNEYLAAALLSDQPALAERATRVAHQVDLTEQGLKAVARWKALAPKDERALWFAGVFETRAHRVDKATAEFENFIRGVGDPGTGFALVLEALADEPNAQATTA